MRLKSIKLAGFKSFVDATTVPFPQNLSAIVGPNGCGKSNIIDAVRWVMGESSARYLRGESMADVIFNGSSGRKPVGQASIELIFDNTDGTLGGEYAKYQEIGVRRQVNRDGKSDYFLNGSRCRRKDITDIFLGTGLGPRSYAIIEQGMISRLIEARPEELRVYIEEAAGISRYKERRKETETRLNNTRDNLARLNDIRDELARQLAHLQKQADAAEKYRALKNEERQTKIQLYGWRWQSLQQELAHYQQQIQLKASQLAESLNAQQHFESAIAQARHQEDNAHQAVHAAQNRVFGIKNSISQTEQQLQHHEQRRQQLKQQAASLSARQQQALAEAEQDEYELAELAQQLIQLLPQQDELAARLDEQLWRVEQAEQQLLTQQQDYEAKQQSAAQTTTQVQLWQNKVQTLEQGLLRAKDRQHRLQQEMGQFATDDLLEEVAIQQTLLAELDSCLHQEQVQQEQISEQLTATANQLQHLHQHLHDLQSQQQQAQGEQSALLALQQAALGRDNHQQAQWLEQQQLAQQPRLAEVLQVKTGFEPWVEKVLGEAISAILVDDLAHIDLTACPAVMLLERQSIPADYPPDALLAYVDSHIGNELLTHVRYIGTVQQALAARSQLAVGQSFICADGYWVGRHWLKVLNAAQQDSVLARQQRLTQLQQSLTQIANEIVVCQQQQQHLVQQQQQWEQQRLQLQRQLSQHLQERGVQQAKLGKLQAQLTQTQLQAQRIARELDELAQQTTIDTELLAEARLQLEDYLESLQHYQTAYEHLQTEREQSRLSLVQLRQTQQQLSQQSHQLALTVQGLHTRQAALAQSQQRQQHYLASLATQQQDLASSLLALTEPNAELTLLLEDYLAEKLVAEEALQASQVQLQALASEYRHLEQQRAQLNASIEPLRQGLEQDRLTWQGVSARQEHLVEQLQALNTTPEMIDGFTQALNEADLQQRLDSVATKIGRLGAINLAAIEEYQQQAERKIYLDNQAQDLEEALTKLETAIKHIDKETRTLFMDTFNQVNDGLQHLFPKVFGGGMAALHLVGEDTLTSGVSITARPPGKKNATIHLLSGGEKALTALALVFAIFQLNPAPFCLLDEVDAPLDDANVSRFCRLVEEMAQQVQFIYITHNKIAMSMAKQLMGVTMHEPGVSRLVSVDVEQAAALAAA